MIKEQMEKIYGNIPLENIPWNIESPPEILIDLITSGKVKQCRAIELGCGTGNNVIYLCSRGFDCTGVDISETAIKIAENSAEEKNVKCNFITADVLGDMAELDGTYDFVYDWMLLHHIYPQDRDKYLANVYKLLKSGGTYLSVCFSEESQAFGGSGKYRTTPLDTVLYFSSENEIKELFQPLFEIEELTTVTIPGKNTQHKAIYTLLTKK